MFDQSFNQITLSRMLRRSDFKDHSDLVDPRVKLEYVKTAVRSARSGFGRMNPLEQYHLDGKQAYRIKLFRDELVIRLLCENIKHVAALQALSREFIVANLIHLLSEGVPDVTPVLAAV